MIWRNNEKIADDYSNQKFEAASVDRVVQRRIVRGGCICGVILTLGEKGLKFLVLEVLICNRSNQINRSSNQPDDRSDDACLAKIYPTTQVRELPHL